MSKQMYLWGECMAEMKALQGSQPVSFAGDAFNTAVYMKRSFPEHQVSFVSVVGKDRYGEQIQQALTNESIGSSLVFRHDEKNTGRYLIATDNNGERCFTYWRNNSAARQIMDFIQSEQRLALSTADVFYFTGISLAILDSAAREKFWSMLEDLRQAEVNIIFDPNYRSALWPDTQNAKREISKAMLMANMALPGMDDLKMLYGIHSVTEAFSLRSTFGVDEIVLKNSADTVSVYHRGKVMEYPVTPVENVVDTTSAGDAFNGVYIGARVSGIDIPDAVTKASRAAAIVIQHHGAIIPARIPLM